MYDHRFYWYTPSHTRYMYIAHTRLPVSLVYLSMSSNAQEERGGLKGTSLPHLHKATAPLHTHTPSNDVPLLSLQTGMGGI